VLSRLVGGLESPAAVRERERLVRDLPIAIDLMAACARAGLPLSLVIPPVAQAVGGPLERRLRMVTSRWDLGADPVREWQALTADPVLNALGAAMVRAHRSGAPLADTLVRVAADARRERRSRALAAARSVAVSSAAPLTMCFLPAFLLVGVVPTVIGGFTHLL
jgi:pilus assembly protein TadC